MDALLQDLRYTLRQLRKSPGFTVIVVLMLALGIGANSALFGIVNAVLLRPLPYPDADRIVEIGLEQPGDRVGMLDGHVAGWLLDERPPSFDAVAAWTSIGANLTGGVEPERLSGSDVTPDFFRVLGVDPSLGRGFTDDDSRAGALPVIVISHGLWVRDFGSDPDVVGRAVKLDDESYTVVGVMPAGFRQPGFNGYESDVDYWRPFELSAVGAFSGTKFVIGRLGTGVAVDRAASEVLALRQRHLADLPEFQRDDRTGVVPLHRQFYGDLRPALLLLLGVVGCVLLLACANVANLLLARATARRKELALRAALGAGRVRLLRQLMVESLVLAVAGGACGLWLASFGLKLFTALAPERLAAVRGIALNGRVVAFTLVVSLVTGLLFGLAPALAAARADLNEVLKEGRARVAGRGGRVGPRRLLVTAELAIAVMLLVGGGLVVKSLARFLATDTGFRAEGVLTADLTIPEARYPDSVAVASFYRQVLERVRALPGVDAAALSSGVPLSSGFGFTGISFASTNVRAEATPENPFIALGHVGAGYFRTYGIQLFAGREFVDEEERRGSSVVIINRSLARALAPDGSAIGKQLELENLAEGSYTVVGVVGDARWLGGDALAPAAMYLPLQIGASRSAGLALRTRLDPESLIPALRRAVRGVDPVQPLGDVTTLAGILDGYVAPRRFNALLFGAFGGLGLILAAFGLYGVIAYLVAQRTHEIGVRMALGAERSDVLALVLRQGMVLTGVGVALGLAAAFGLTRFLASLLFQVDATDPVVFVGVPLLLVLVSMVATLVPARRATRVDPMVALRAE